MKAMKRANRIVAWTLIFLLCFSGSFSYALAEGLGTAPSPSKSVEENKVLLMSETILPTGSTGTDLQAAVNSASTGNVIIVTGDMPFTDAVTIPAGKDLTIGSDTGNQWTLEQSGANVRHFIVNGGLTLENIVLDGSTEESSETAAGGGIEVGSDGELAIKDGAVIQNCKSTANGGGVFLDVGGSLTMTGGEVSGNNADKGGGIYASRDASVTLSGGEISSNAASGYGGGICAVETAVVNMSGGKISQNKAKFGGGISGYSFDNSDDAISVISITGGEISGNSTINYGSGGGIHLGKNDVLTVGDTQNTLAAPVITGNSSAMNGGGIDCHSKSSVAIFSATKIFSNEAGGSGGGICGSGDSNIEVYGTAEIFENTAVYYGGGILNNLIKVYENAQIRDNYTEGKGGGLCAVTPDATSVETVISVYGNSKVTGNTAMFDGGGIFANNWTQFDQEPLSISIDGNAEISGNTATMFDGGGIYTISLEAVTVGANVTFANNTAASGYAWNLNAPQDTQQEDDAELHKTNILTKSFTHPFSNAYSNYDINYATDYNIYVLYDANGGTGGYLDAGFLLNSQYTVLALGNTGIARSNHSFDGWNTEPGGDGTSYEPGNTFTLEENMTLYAQWTYNGGGGVTPSTYTVAYLANGGIGSHQDSGIAADTSYLILDDDSAGISRSDYVFTGWNTEPDGSGTAYDPGDTITISSNVTLYAQWKSSEGTYSVVYEPNGGTGKAYSVTEDLETAHIVLANSGAGLGFTRSGYIFRGWSTDSAATTASYFGSGSETIGEAAKDGDTITLYAIWSELRIPGGETEIDDDEVPLGDLDLTNHFAYIIGYTDGSVQPESNITRSEVATIFFRLLTQESRAEIWSRENNFPDVASGSWCNNAISTLVRGNIIKGNPDGTFRPDNAISRAEFAVIAAKFATDEDIANASGMAAFSDIGGHWAEDYIVFAGALGYVRGYGDGTFRPDGLISRAEAATLLNNVLNRHVDSRDDLHHDMITWPDNKPGTWHYYAVQEATNSHFYDKKDDGANETWTEIRPRPDWAALEKPDSMPEDVVY